MTGQLSWTREGEMPALHGELDQGLLVPFQETRTRTTGGATTTDLNRTARMGMADLALSMHFVTLIHHQGWEAQLIVRSENLQTLIDPCGLPVDIIP